MTKFKWEVLQHRYTYLDDNDIETCFEDNDCEIWDIRPSRLACDFVLDYTDYDWADLLTEAQTRLQGFLAKKCYGWPRKSA